MTGSLAPFFAARSVAVIGASADPSKIGGSVLANLRAGGFAGRLVPVNAARPVVQGLPAVPSIVDAEPVPELEELEINPLVAGAEGEALDARGRTTDGRVA